MRSITFGLGIAVGLVFSVAVVAAWAGPSSSPPNGNIAAPVNVGTTDQVKDAGLGVNSLAIFGNAILSGTSNYLNFGTTAGSSGYGIRNNSGILEFKNNDGSWATLQSTIYNIVGEGVSSIVQTSVRQDLVVACNGSYTNSIQCPSGYIVSGCSAWTGAFYNPAGATISGNGCSAGCGRGDTNSLAVEAVCIKLQ